MRQPLPPPLEQPPVLLSDSMSSLSLSESESGTVMEWQLMQVTMRTSRHLLSSVNIGNQIFAIGGESTGEPGNLLDSVEWLDAQNYQGGWNMFPSIATRRSACAAVAVVWRYQYQAQGETQDEDEEEKRLVVLGGWDGFNFLRSVEMYDPTILQWNSLPNMSTNRLRCAAVSLGSKIYCIGGFDGTSHLDSVEMLDLETGIWTTLSKMLRKRSNCVAVAIPSTGKIFVAGGYDEQSFHDSAELYDVATDTWMPLPSMATKRCGAAAALVMACKIVCLGGRNSSRTALRSCEMYDISTQRWSTLPNMSSKRHGCAAVAIENRVMVMGGFDGRQKYMDCCEELIIPTEILEPRRKTTTLKSPKSPADSIQPPQLPTIPGIPGRRERKVALEKWMETARTMKETYQQDVETAKSRLVQQYNDQNRLFENRIQKLMERVELYKRKVRSNETKRDETVASIDRVSESWIANAEEQLEDAEDQVHMLATKLAAAKQKTNSRHGSLTSKSTPAPKTMEPPSQLVCPITYELMDDPVIAADGHTYEREAIEKVFDQTKSGCNPRSPSTGQELPTRMLLPNVAIRSQCREFTEQRKPTKAQQKKPQHQHGYSI